MRARERLGQSFYIGLALMMLIGAVAKGQDAVPPPTESASNEQFVPVDQMEAVFDRDRRGVLMKRAEFNELLEKARANAAKSDVPVPIITEQASITVTPGDQQAIVTMEFKVRQYAEGWQILTIRAGNLLVEKVEIDNKPALISRNPANPNEILLAHEAVGEFTVVATMSTQLGSLGSDRTAAFELPMVPATQMSVTCPADKQLLVNDLKLDPPNAEGKYIIPSATRRMFDFGGLFSEKRMKPRRSSLFARMLNFRCRRKRCGGKAIRESACLADRSTRSSPEFPRGWK